jgi:seryl-tRNA synthetase
VLEGAGYHKSFPDLMGSVHVFEGDDRRHGELVQLADDGGDWESLFAASDVALASAACHPVYPLCSGTLAAGGRRFDVASYCFRHEPSVDPVRMQAFEMHELVFVGRAEDAVAHRDQYLTLALKALDELGLRTETEVANDPFFGRRGRMIAAAQREEVLKIEVVTPVSSDTCPTAVVSGNCHRDHFGSAFAIDADDGTVAHSACVAFGVDRLVLALYRRHGLELSAWPAAVRNRLFG